jgi:1-deoxy-D-xylulose-5-phosphate reductoisomerase
VGYAANEVAVAAFLERRLRFTGIAQVIERAMDEFERHSPDVGSLGQIRDLDRQARVRAAELVRSEA